MIMQSCIGSISASRRKYVEWPCDANDLKS